VTRDDGAVPGFADDLIKIDDASAVRRQRPEDVKRLRPQAKVDAVPEHAAAVDVDRKGSEGDIRQRRRDYSGGVNS